MSPALKKLMQLTNEQLVQAYQETDKPALKKLASDALVRKNLGLVRKIANQYPVNGTDVTDRINEGVIGLLNAIPKYDVTKSVPFSTHAWWWIKQNILRECNAQGSLIRTPSNVTEARMKVNKLKKRIEQDTGRFATAEEIAELGNLKLKDVKHILDSQGTVAGSIDNPITSEEGSTSAHEVYGGSTLISEILSDHHIEILRSALESLHPNERFLLECILALGEDGMKYSFKDLEGVAVSVDGKVLNTASTVSSHYNKALSRLMHILETKGIKTARTVEQQQQQQIEQKKNELTFNALLLQYDVENVLNAIDMLHDNEQLIVQAVHGLIDDEEWTFEDLAGNCYDCEDNLIETVKQVQAEYKYILRELKEILAKMTTLIPA